MNMSNKFYQADSSNLPEMNTLIICEYIMTSENYNVDIIRTVKKLAASEDHYVEDAIGYVRLKRGNDVCIVKAKVVPEGPVRNKYYSVSVIINEKENAIVDTTCNCQPNSDGGCKHTLLFLVWLQKKATIPERAPVQCFYHKPLSTIPGLSPLGKDIFKSKSSKTAPKMGPKNPEVLKDFFEECKKRNIKNSLILNYAPPEEE